MSSHDNDTSQSEHIPLDLTIEILSRLPAKSVGRFRSVSKLWSTITTSQDFVNSFATRSWGSRSSVLLTVRKDDILFVFSSSLHKNSSDGQFSCVGSYQFTNPNFGNLFGYYYVHGLIFLQGTKQLVIWNPTLKRFLTLPKPEGKCESGCIVVGYDSSEGKYIVLRVLRGFTICIHTLGTQGQGLCEKIITMGVPRHIPTIHFCGCINGVMYYGAAVFVDIGLEHYIISFDVRSEKFNQIKCPERNFLVSSHMVPYEGRLAIVNTMNLPSIELWILKNGDRHEWTHKHFVLPLAEMDPIRTEKLCFYGVSYVGELIFTQRRLFGSFYILYFNPRRNSIRDVLFEGNVGDAFRSSYGFGKDCMYTMNVYPNHIQSLVSL
ncbi:F-box associated domain type 3 [Arabidopsis thaliana x Arabidopsis arenosa]|uniref:F-box associated domain type 3 n=1 Tax=Arabidopsis thaliana x Arabidopsis arenosa TaxID=1240361 RepID=A0A8T2BDX1_9BRAS|nr:F-box associated domain type 3 [Arabidopsis thaliana x Arabidopsis arenosa]